MAIGKVRRELTKLEKSVNSLLRYSIPMDGYVKGTKYTIDTFSASPTNRLTVLKDFFCGFNSGDITQLFAIGMDILPKLPGNDDFSGITPLFEGMMFPIGFHTDTSAVEPWSQDPVFYIKPGQFGRLYLYANGGGSEQFSVVLQCLRGYASFAS